jgi:wobble nucleotide-excising tRNase
MIATIKIQDFASYSPTSPTTISINKPVAVFYGDNGAGKSTIARAIRQHAQPELGKPGSSTVAIDGLLAPEFFIYDVDYVEDNFHTRDHFRGIFTLGKKTAEELGELEALEEEIHEISSNTQELNAKLTLLSANGQKALNSAKDSTWPIKSDYEQGPLRYCLEEHRVRGDKAKLFQHLSGVKEVEETTLIEDLLREAAEVEDEAAAEKHVIEIPKCGFSSVESSNLPGSVIAASTDSRLSALIGALQNESWVRQGKEYLHGSGDACPFCQQGLPHDFTGELSKLFDNAYETSRGQLEELRDEYAKDVKVLYELFRGPAFEDEYVTTDLAFQNVAKDLRLVLDGNLKALNDKLANPAVPSSLKTSSGALSDWTAHASRLAESAMAYNLRISNRVIVKREIDKRFWEKMRKEYSAPLAAYQLEAVRVTDEIEATEKSLAALKLQAREKAAKLRELRTASTSIEASIDAINRRIQNIGIKGFAIEKNEANEGYYHIVRGAKGKVSYKSLSEGERTLVTFLYFIESLQGSHSSDGASNKPNRVIIIDDPVSSLSHNHVYDIASLITTILIDSKEFPLVVVLTHSLFFYHELFKLAPSAGKGYQCFRVTKDEFSSVCEMKSDEIKNDYQAYWLVLKEAIESQKYSVAIPIAMRYILEHYFSFIGAHAKLNAALKELGDKDQVYRSFYRYINRQSHADDINITDLPSVNPGIYVDKFRQIFDDTNQAEHYARMMDI